ncbi:MAG: tripartite tricarboxylate transporter TctB family protein [Nocardioidaceae bacterium]
MTAAFGIAVLLYVRSFPQLPDGAPGPALFPGIIGALFVFFGLILVIRSFLHRGTASEARAGQDTAQDEPAPDETEAGAFQSIITESIPARTAWINALSVLGSIVFYLLVSDLLGFSLTMAVLLIALMWRLGARPVVAIASSVATTFVLYLVFERVLLVPLPTGIFG